MLRALMLLDDVTLRGAGEVSGLISAKFTYVDYHDGELLDGHVDLIGPLTEADWQADDWEAFDYSFFE